MAPVERAPPLPSKLLRVSNCVAYALLIVVNVGSGLGWWGDSNDKISRRHPTPLTPSGWAFSIWGVIFVLQGVAVTYGVLPWGNTLSWKRQAVNTVGYGWQLGWAFQCTWQLLFPRESIMAFWLCLVMLAAAFGAFAATLRRLYVLAAASQSSVHPIMYALFYVPTSINTAWLSVATALGALVVAGAHGAGARAEAGVATTLLLCAALLCAVVLLQERDGVYGLTLIWACTAIAGNQHSNKLIYVTSIVCLSVLGLLTILAFTRQRRTALLVESDMQAGLLLGQASLESQLSRHASMEEGAARATSTSAAAARTTPAARAALNAKPVD